MIRKIYVPAIAFTITALVIIMGLIHPTTYKLTAAIGASHTISPVFTGVNGNLTGFHQPWDNDSLGSAAKKTNAGTLRYPAGTIGNTWDWELGWLDQDVNDPDLMPWVVEQNIKNNSNRYTLENLALGIKKTKTIPVLMLNMLTRDINHSMIALRKLQKLGVPIRYVELGNEFYFNLPLEMRIFPTPEDYGKTCKIWIDSIKTEFPEAKCAVIGTTLNRKSRQKNWTERVLKYADNADAVTWHIYIPLDFQSMSLKDNIMPGKEAMTNNTMHNISMVDRQKQELKQLQNPSNFSYLLNSVTEAISKYHTMNIPEHMDVWITEFNFRADSSAVRGTWANTMALLFFYNKFLELQSIKLTNYHNITGDLFPAIYISTSGFDYLKHVQLEAKSWTLSSGGLALYLMGEVTSGKSDVQEIKISPKGFLSHSNTGADKNIGGWLFSGEDDQIKGILLNFTDRNAKINIRKLGLMGSYTSYQTSLTSYILDMNTLNTEMGSLKNTIILKPYSATLISCIAVTTTSE